MPTAISFDLWDTLICDDSDESERARLGLPTKSDARRQLICEAYERSGDLNAASVESAWRRHEKAARTAWIEDFRTWTLEDRLRRLDRELGHELNETVRGKLFEELETMEIVILPEVVPGAKEALAALSERFRLAVVSDAIFTPGRRLREMLARHGLFEYFEAFAFSDEVGRSKPAPEIFMAAAEALAVSPEDMIHVGDRESNDVRGARALGMRAVLFVGARDRGQDGSEADACCRAMAELPAVIDTLIENGQP